MQLRKRVHGIADLLWDLLGLEDRIGKQSPEECYADTSQDLSAVSRISGHEDNDIDSQQAGFSKRGCMADSTAGQAIPQLLCPLAR
jgi:hypothetical protein